MRLNQVIDNLQQFADSQNICVKRPWSFDSEVRLTNEAPEEDDDWEDVLASTLEELRSLGFDYLMSVQGAKKLLQRLEARSPSLAEKVYVATYYAEHDALPDEGEAGWPKA